jgi:hypothetical protein
MTQISIFMVTIVVSFCWEISHHLFRFVLWYSNQTTSYYMYSSFTVWIQLDFKSLIQLLPINFSVCIQEGAVLLHLRTLVDAVSCLPRLVCSTWI